MSKAGPVQPEAPSSRKVRLPDGGVRGLFGPRDENLSLIESLLEVRLAARGNEVQVEGADGLVERVARMLEQLGRLVEGGFRLTRDELRTACELASGDGDLSLKAFFMEAAVKVGAQRLVLPKSLNQKRYLESMRQHDIVFAIGPAGTGKTYLAIAMAVAALNERGKKRIILARPAVEAGEKLGFLPGDMYEKVHPYLRPLYDALHDLLDADLVSRYIDRGIIEVAPIAFMRGRTLNDSFVILDEAQNTTSEQMKMFLTRLGYNSKAVITGDVTQIDLPPGTVSGLKQAESVLAAVEGLDFAHFDERDVVRHPLVQSIIKAYERYETAQDVEAEGVP